MTVCCGSRDSPTGDHPASWSESWPGSCCRSPANVTRRSARRFRSTKGASKARRDHINAEIRNMRGLLPIPPEDQERLSYLHSMSTICTFIRKSIFFGGLRSSGGSDSALPYDIFFQALPGFLVAVSREGRLLYVSENVADFLGFSMVDILQWDTFYDMVDSADVEMVKSNLETGSTASAERSFVCRMYTSKAFRLRHGPGCYMLVSGYFCTTPGTSSPHPDLDQAFLALCTPTANRWQDGDSHGSSQPFRTLHRADMSFTHTSESVLFFLGYLPEEMISRSWYSMVHPEDLQQSAFRHRSLLGADEGTVVEMVVRLQHKDLTWVWLYIRATKDCGKQEVTCMNYVIGETEAIFLKQRIYTDDTDALAPPLQEVTQPWCRGDAASRPLKRQSDTSGENEEPHTKSRCSSGSASCYEVYVDQACIGGQQVALSSSPVLPTTPPYSPASLRSPVTPDDGSTDFFLDAYSYAETHLSPPQSSGLYHPSPSTLSDPVPIATDLEFGLLGFTSPSAQSCPSPSYEFSSYPADSRLVPGCPQALDVTDYSSDEVFHPDDFSLPDLPQEGGNPFLSLQEAPGVPLQADGLPTPDPSPTSECCFPYSESEQTEISILARQISSLASSFDTYRSTEPTLSPAARHPKVTPDSSSAPPYGLLFPTSPPFKLEVVLDENVIDSILQDMDLAPGRDALGSLGSSLGGSGDVPRAQDTPAGQSVSLLFTLLSDFSLDQFLSTQPTLDSPVRSGCQLDSNELHQLSHYLQNSLQQDELAEESM